MADTLRRSRAASATVALNEITGDMLRDYQRRRRQTAGPGMINKECGIVCMIRDRIGLALTDYQRMPMPKDYESPGRALTTAEEAKLERVFKAAADHRNGKPRRSCRCCR
jgi:hypothetical protein